MLIVLEFLFIFVLKQYKNYDLSTYNYKLWAS